MIKYGKWHYNNHFSKLEDRWSFPVFSDEEYVNAITISIDAHNSKSRMYEKYSKRLWDKDYIERNPPKEDVTEEDIHYFIDYIFEYLKGKK